MMQLTSDSGEVVNAVLSSDGTFTLYRNGMEEVDPGVVRAVIEGDGKLELVVGTEVLQLELAGFVEKKAGKAERAQESADRVFGTRAPKTRENAGSARSVQDPKA